MFCSSFFFFFWPFLWIWLVLIGTNLVLNKIKGYVLFLFLNGFFLAFPRAPARYTNSAVNFAAQYSLNLLPNKGESLYRFRGYSVSTIMVNDLIV
jgi:hypothetical protein